MNTNTTETVSKNKLYKELIDQMYDVAAKGNLLKEEMKNLANKFSTMLPTEDVAVKQMLQICESEAVQKLNPHCLIQFYGDRYDLLKVGYQIPEDIRYCCEDVNDHYDLRMHVMDEEGYINVLELGIEVDADYIITSIKANWG